MKESFPPHPPLRIFRRKTLNIPPPLLIHDRVVRTSFNASSSTRFLLSMCQPQRILRHPYNTLRPRQSWMREPIFVIRQHPLHHMLLVSLSLLDITLSPSARRFLPGRVGVVSLIGKRQRKRVDQWIVRMIDNYMEEGLRHNKWWGARFRVLETLSLTVKRIKRAITTASGIVICLPSFLDNKNRANKQTYSAKRQEKKISDTHGNMGEHAYLVDIEPNKHMLHCFGIEQPAGLVRL